jgi:hypothetical protein
MCRLRLPRRFPFSLPPSPAGSLRRRGTQQKSELRKNMGPSVRRDRGLVSQGCSGYARGLLPRADKTPHHFRQVQHSARFPLCPLQEVLATH